MLGLTGLMAYLGILKQTDGWPNLEQISTLRRLVEANDPPGTAYSPEEAHFQ